MIAKHKALIAFALALALLAGVGFLLRDAYSSGYDAGVSHQLAEQAAQVALHIEAERDLRRQLIEARAKTEVIYRDRIETIRVAGDPSGCAGTAIPDERLRLLDPEPGDTATGPVPDDGL